MSNAFQQHNRQQVGYFEASVKKNMLPRDDRYLRRHVDELVRYGGLRSSERVLEVGAAMGRYTMLLAEKGLRVDAIDLSAAMLEKLDEFNAGRYPISTHAMDVADAPADWNGRYDAVVALFTLHHFHTLDAPFQAMARLLRPGGRVVFLEPNPLNPLYYVQIALKPGMTWQGEKGMRWMRPSIVNPSLERAGLLAPRFERFGFFPPFISNHQLGAAFEKPFEAFPIWRPMLPFQLIRAEKAQK